MAARSRPTSTAELHPILTTATRRLKRTCNDIVRETAQNKDRPDFPVGGLVIGSNGGGIFSIFLPDSSPGRFADAVYWWDHETGHVAKVAADLDELSD